MNRNKRRNQQIVTPQKEAGESKTLASSGLIAKHQEFHWEGPVLPPHILNRFNEVVPNGADRVLTLTENQSNHRLEIEKMVIEDRIKSKRLGQILAFILCVLIISLGGIMTFYGNAE